MNENGKVPLIVTTAHKGVFFGYGQRTHESAIELERARMCVYWSTELHGVIGLASTGPNKNCKVGPAADRIILRDVTAIIDVTKEAAINWEKEIWS